MDLWIYQRAGRKNLYRLRRELLLVSAFLKRTVENILKLTCHHPPFGISCKGVYYYRSGSTRQILTAPEDRTIRVTGRVTDKVTDRVTDKEQVTLSQLAERLGVSRKTVAVIKKLPPPRSAVPGRRHFCIIRFFMIIFLMIISIRLYSRYPQSQRAGENHYSISLYSSFPISFFIVRSASLSSISSPSSSAVKFSATACRSSPQSAPMTCRPSPVIWIYTWRRFFWSWKRSTRSFSSSILISFVSCCLVMSSFSANADMVRV